MVKVSELSFSENTANPCPDPATGLGFSFWPLKIAVNGTAGCCAVSSARKNPLLLRADTVAVVPVEKVSFSQKGSSINAFRWRAYGPTSPDHDVWKFVPLVTVLPVKLST